MYELPVGSCINYRIDKYLILRSRINEKLSAVKINRGFRLGYDGLLSIRVCVICSRKIIRKLLFEFNMRNF